MGIDSEYIRITSIEYNELQVHPELVEKFLGHEDLENGKEQEFYDLLIAQGRLLYLWKTWQAIHYLVTGEITEPGNSNLNPPMRNFVMGGRSSKHSGYKDIVRFLTPFEVAEVGRWLKELSPDIVKQNFRNKQHMQIDIYRYSDPNNWDDECLEEIIGYYTELRDFYLQAYKSDNAMLIMIC